MTASGGTLSDGAIFGLIIVFLALAVVGTIVLWQHVMDRERAEAERRAKAQRVRHVITDRRLALLHVVESDPGKVINIINPKEPTP